MSTISIIVPIYNSEKFLDNCIKSIMNQSFSDFELLCIDDGSTDNSGKILDDYAKKDNRIKVFHNSNHGVSYTRNFGIENSSSPYIVFIDSDDTVNYQYLQQLYSGISDECNLAICGMKITDKLPYSGQSTQGHFNTITFSPKDEHKLAFCITNRYFNYVWAKIFSSDIIKTNNIQFDEKISLGEDTFFVFDYLKFVDTFCLNESPLYYYNKHSGSLTNTVRPDLFDCLTTGTELIKNFFSQKNIFGTEIQLAIDQRRVLAAEWACHPIFHSNVKNKFKSAKKILNDIELKESLKRLKKANKLNKIQRLMCYRSPLILNLYYDKIEGKLSIKHIIKTLLHL